MSETSPQNLKIAEQIALNLEQKISAGEWAVGSKLPSENQLKVEYGVSRTAVREAISRLRSQGLVEARQGAGAFVINDKLTSHQPTFKSVSVDLASSILEVFEIRLAVESEAAKLAAERRSPTQMAQIFEALRALRDLTEAQTVTPEADFKFHLAIAEAANNRRFPEFLRLLGGATIQRAQVENEQISKWNREYFALIHAEHQRICDAIADRHPKEAFDAMTTHLKGSRERYCELTGNTNLYDKLLTS